jgi:inner membrane protein
MLILAHTGITLGSAVILGGTLKNSRVKRSRIGVAYDQNQQSSIIGSWLSSLAKYVDIRLLLIGSMLPDIIDKPIGQLFFLNTFHSGRIFGHTLIFCILMIAGGMYLYWSRKRTWMLALSYGTTIHLVLDMMWLEPKTLLWPLYGFSFEKLDLTYWIDDMLSALFSNPLVGIPELVGLMIVAWFLWRLIKRGKVLAFIRKGEV